MCLQLSACIVIFKVRFIKLSQSNKLFPLIASGNRFVPVSNRALLYNRLNIITIYVHLLFGANYYSFLSILYLEVSLV
ncbi:hypothetical protein JHK87_056888 [Glycine soja]|nr:hypothetical protein JHK87_056888 [Glycine soja]